MLNRSLSPAIHPITSLDLPPVQITPLDNKSRLHCLYSNQLPIIKLEIVLKAGKWYETKRGVSYFTAKMLLEGTRKLSAKQIADIIAFYGASLEVTQGYDRTSITLYCLNKHILNLINLIKEVLLTPSFPDKEFQLLKTRTLQNLSIEKEKTSYLATKELTNIIYGKDHPYVIGMEENQIKDITQADLQNFYKSYYNSGETEVFISGEFNDLVIDEVKEIFKQKSNDIFPINPPVKKDTLSLYSLISKPGKVQSSIRLGRTLPLMNHKNYPGLILLNKILGGYFGSRLMKNLREEKGFTYGISSVISPKENDTIFYIGTDIKVENTAETLSEIKKEINLLQTTLVREEELETVKNYTIGKFLNETSTIFDQSEKYKTLICHQLPLNFYSTYLTDLEKTTPETIMKLANDYLKEEDLNEVVVGSK